MRGLSVRDVGVICGVGLRELALREARRCGGGEEAGAAEEKTGEEKDEPDDVVVVPGSGALDADDAGFNEALLAAKVRAAAPTAQNAGAGLDEDDALVNEALLAAKVRAAGAPVLIPSQRPG